jgi:GDPmannose 4,6-dehydratase
MRALITGVNGQDGRYLSEFLLGKGYEVFGLDPYRVNKIEAPPDVMMIPGDLLDPGSLHRALGNLGAGDEVYNLGAMSYVGDSWDRPALVGQVNGIGTLNLLEACRDKHVRFYQASTSEMFGSTPPPQNEQTAFHPRSPYGVAKLYAHWAVVNYRESYGMQNYCGILFNHESPRRGHQFVSKKIASGVAAIKHGQAETISLGNLDAARDWGFAWDFVEAMWMMVQGEPDDYVIATGELHTVEEMVSIAFSHVDLDWNEHVVIDERFIRPAEVHALQGDITKALRMGWEPKTTFEELVKGMVDYEMRHFVQC